jgi:hypothetical protein
VVACVVTQSRERLVYVQAFPLGHHALGLFDDDPAVECVLEVLAPPRRASTPAAAGPGPAMGGRNLKRGRSERRAKCCPCFAMAASHLPAEEPTVVPLSTCQARPPPPDYATGACSAHRQCVRPPTM